MKTAQFPELAAAPKETPNLKVSTALNEYAWKHRTRGIFFYSRKEFSKKFCVWARGKDLNYPYPTCLLPI
jgi:hypothetical protein